MDMQTRSFNPDGIGWQGLTMTLAASTHICSLLTKEPDLVGVRLSIKQTGCAGYGYVLDMIREPQQGDLLYEFHGARLWVEASAMPFIDGTEIDFVREGLNQLFKFNNPKAQHACGCGESFGI